MANGENMGVGLEENLKKALTELLLLYLLSQKACYISELTEAIHRRSGGMLAIVFPYGAIYRLQQSGWIQETEKKQAPDGRRRQYFAITEVGRVRLQELVKTYQKFIRGVDCILSEGGGFL